MAFIGGRVHGIEEEGVEDGNQKKAQTNTTSNYKP